MNIFKNKNFGMVFITYALKLVSGKILLPKLIYFGKYFFIILFLQLYWSQLYYQKLLILSEITDNISNHCTIRNLLNIHKTYQLSYLSKIQCFQNKINISLTSNDFSINGFYSGKFQIKFNAINLHFRNNDVTISWSKLSVVNN